MKAYFKLFSHIDLDGYSCNLIMSKLPVASECTNVNYDKINEVIRDYITSGEYKNYEFTFITDISVNEEVAELINNTKDLRLKLLDHHPTALWLNKYIWAGVQVELNGEKTCGTELLFKQFKDTLYCQEDVDRIERFVTEVKRYDTWLWKEKYNDENPKKINDLFCLLGYERFENQVKNNLFNVELIMSENKLLLELQQEKIDKYIESKNKQILPFQFDKYYLGVVFGEQFHSELGNKLSELNPQFDAIAIISDKGISYRTVKDNINCGELATLLGGGGHPKASGSRISEESRIKYIKTVFNLD